MTNSLDRSILARFSPGFGGTKIPDWLKSWLDKGLGGVTLFSSNCPSFEETARLIAELRSYSPHLIISIDEEGGDVTRLFVREGSPFATPALLGKCDSLDLTYSTYRTLGSIMKEVGIDITFAPVADVVVKYENPIVGVRSFGMDFDLVSRHIKQAVSGFQDAGIAATVKHFPGHGGVLEDTHHQLPELQGSIDDLEKSHLKPFIAAIEADTACIMVGHIVAPSIDPNLPASLSPDIISQVIRGRYGFEGLVVTDALDMGALGGPRKIAQSALGAFKAGNDLLCFSGLYDQSEFVSSSFSLIKESIVDENMIIESSERIQKWKPLEPNKKLAPLVDVSTELSRGFEVTGNVEIPVGPVTLIEISAEPTIAAGYVAWGLNRPLLHAGYTVQLETSDSKIKVSDDFRLIVAFRDAFRDAKVFNALKQIQNDHPEALFVDMGWPTISFNSTRLVRTYGSPLAAAEAVVTLISRAHQRN